MSITISNQELSEYNKQGLIPGPNETESEFKRRVEYCLGIKDHLSEKTGITLPHYHPSKEGLATTQELYDISPEWVPVIYDNHKLSPWHGGCAWIFQCDEDSPLSAILQLRKSLTDSNNVYGFLNKNEIIAHEACHIGRMAFEEPVFEEVLAYRTSKSWFRRAFGPIVKNSIESGLFVLLLFMIFLIDLFFLFFGNEQALLQVMWLKLIPLAMVGYGFIRLGRRHREFGRCLQSLTELSGSESVASSIIYRLTDQEIILFGKLPVAEIIDYVDEQKVTSLRWKMIDFCYFSFSH